jgi:hypothetical protein
MNSENDRDGALDTLARQSVIRVLGEQNGGRRNYVALL